MRGLQEGFVITEANKKTVKNVQDLTDAISGKGQGDSVLLKVMDKNGTERIVAVKLQ
jgi:S1-C subfamily serine protease